MIWRCLAAAILVAMACTRPAIERPSAPAGGEELIVSEGQATLVLDAKTGATLRTLPAGVLSPAKDAIISLHSDPLACSGLEPCTYVAAYDLRGKILEEWRLDDRYVLPATYGPAPSGFSPNGRWLVLVKRDAALSTFAILDLSAVGPRSAADGPELVRSAGGRAKGRWEQITLGSRFSFDAIHNDGAALYIIEHPVAGSTAYNVRLYEVRSKRLVPEPIFDKAQLVTFDPTTGLMDGAFHASVAPTGGQWSYGLYVRRDGRPFVHALNVAARYATCILDLPGTRSGSSMLALALRPDARRLFVTDTGAGAVSEIDAETQKVRRSGSFAVRAGSADGSRLYALANSAVHVLEAPSGRPIAEHALPSNARAITTVTVR